MNNNSGLYRNQHDAVLGGVCSGIADSLNVDPILIRIVFILLAIFGGSGVLLYLILWIAVPVNLAGSYKFDNQKTEKMEAQNQNEGAGTSGPNKPPDHKPKNDGNLIAGLILITLGLIFLLERWIHWLDFADLWPLLLVIGGIVLIRRSYFKP